jgi:hypothetical protein
MIIESEIYSLQYTTHPDFTLILAEMFHDKVNWIAIASWKGMDSKTNLRGKSTTKLCSISLIER